jgi:hypothetical protein
LFQDLDSELLEGDDAPRKTEAKQESVTVNEVPKPSKTRDTPVSNNAESSKSSSREPKVNEKPEQLSDKEKSHRESKNT